MKSSIKIDFADNGNGLEPIIRCILVDSDDPRDKLIKSLFESLGTKSYLEIEYPNYSDKTIVLIHKPKKKFPDFIWTIGDFVDDECVVKNIWFNETQVIYEVENELGERRTIEYSY